jgi:hypothetical protein
MKIEQVAIGVTVRCPKGHEHTYRPSDHLGGGIYCVKGECWSEGCQGDSGSGTHYKVEELTLVSSVKSNAFQVS